MRYDPLKHQSALRRAPHFGDPIEQAIGRERTKPVRRVCHGTKASSCGMSPFAGIHVFAGIVVIGFLAEHG
jgi:hypothetical protein